MNFGSKLETSVGLFIEICHSFKLTPFRNELLMMQQKQFLERKTMIAKLCLSKAYAIEMLNVDDESSSFAL